MGDEALKRHLELRLRPHGPSSWAEALAYEVTRPWAMPGAQVGLVGL